MAGPLTEQDLNDINDALTALQEAEQQATLATQAGIDVSNQVKQIRDNREKLMKIKQVYFPGQ